MSERIDVFRMDELRVSCTCPDPECGTEIVVFGKPERFTNKCPGCEGSLSPMSEILNLLFQIREKSKRDKLDLKLIVPSSKE
jgi:hypothetical protein